MHTSAFFWFAVGVLVTVALLVVVYPLASGQSRGSLWAALPRWALPAGAGLLVAALGLYLWLGSPQLAATDSMAVAAVPGEQAPLQAGPHTVGCDALRARLRRSCVSRARPARAARGGAAQRKPAS